MFESGIYGRLKEEEIRLKYYLHRKPVKRVESSLFQPLELEGAIVTVFILCGGIILGAGMVFLVEIRYRIDVRMKNMIYLFMINLLRKKLSGIFLNCM